MTTSICVNNEDRDEFNKLRFEYQAKFGKEMNHQSFFKIIIDNYKVMQNGENK